MRTAKTLFYQYILFQTSHVRKYLLCERWKNVERPLRQSAQVLSIWNAWGQDKNIVRCGKEITLDLNMITSSFLQICVEKNKKGKETCSKNRLKIMEKAAKWSKL